MLCCEFIWCCLLVTEISSLFMKTTRSIFFSVLVPCLSFSAINIDGFATLENDRFSVAGEGETKNFVAAGYDMSGIAISDSGHWVTMVSENVFISANHFFPADNTSVTFYSSNDPSGPSLTRTVNTSQRIGSSDLRIGVLDQALTGDYAHYSFLTGDLDFGGDGFFTTPSTALLLGRSETAFTTSQDMAVGVNAIDYWIQSATAAGTTDSALATILNDVGDANYRTYEAGLQGGDSGAPLLGDDGFGNLTIVGINWFIGQVDTNGEVAGGVEDVNGFSYVGNYDTEIQTYIDANAVPELSNFAWMLGVLGAGRAWMRRR